MPAKASSIINNFLYLIVLFEGIFSLSTFPNLLIALSQCFYFSAGEDDFCRTAFGYVSQDFQLLYPLPRLKWLIACHVVDILHAKIQKEL